jgi:hypothetical protein
MSAKRCSEFVERQEFILIREPKLPSVGDEANFALSAGMKFFEAEEVTASPAVGRGEAGRGAGALGVPRGEACFVCWPRGDVSPSTVGAVQQNI